MVLTNAQRQTRFRQRLKARADGADVGQQAQAAVDAGFAAMWAIYSRPAADGRVWGDIDEMSGVLDLKRNYRGHATEALATLEDWLHPDESTMITADERGAIERAVAIYQAALLKHVPAPERVTNSRKR